MKSILNCLVSEMRYKNKLDDDGYDEYDGDDNIYL